MCPAKLSVTEKQTLVDLYRQTPATTSTLAEKFGVSSSTISRLLKAAMPKAEYDGLVQQKRGKRPKDGDSQLALPLPDASPNTAIAPPILKSKNSAIDTPKNPNSTELITETDSEPAASSSRTRKRSRTRTTGSDESKSQDLKKDPSKRDAPSPVVDESLNEPDTEADSHIDTAPSQTELLSVSAEEAAEIDERSTTSSVTQNDEIEAAVTMALYPSDLDEIVKDLDDDLDLLDDEDEDEDIDDEDEDEDDEDDTEEIEEAIPSFVLQVRPFAEAELPKNCYLVIDKMAELIVLPLKAFAPSDTIPETEVQEKTLPIFDNHRVAKRFSHRNQRVIKVPDSNIFYKTIGALKAKGITRIFLDGSVFSLY